MGRTLRTLRAGERRPVRVRLAAEQSFRIIFLPAIEMLGLLTCCTILMQSSHTVPRPPYDAASYKLVFADDFSALDVSQNGSGAHAWYQGVWFSHKLAPAANISASA